MSFDVTRFFVSPAESGEICLMACILGHSAEIFFPKLDLDRDLINFDAMVTLLLTEFGYIPHLCDSEDEAKNSMVLIKDGRYPVYFFQTDMSGEKLYEEFYTDAESYTLDRFHSLGVITKRPNFAVSEFKEIIDESRTLLENPDNTKSDVISWLKMYIPEFNHIERGLDLDKKM